MRTIGFRRRPDDYNDDDDDNDELLDAGPIDST
jgi:hypothetical protein